MPGTGFPRWEQISRLKWRHNSHHLVWVFPSYMSVDIVARLDVLPASHVGLTPVVHYEALSTTPGIEFDRKHSFPSVADDFQHRRLDRLRTRGYAAFGLCRI
ncbi:hypothetical protein PC122_g17959 [Phytophthora cactorum]|nr:hypothetical protein PC122_g17959 [Phytophthora cactorum]